MAVDMSKLDTCTLQDLLMAYSDNDDKALTVPELKAILVFKTHEEVFDRWMDWQGMIGWSGRVKSALKSIEAAIPLGQ